MLGRKGVVINKGIIILPLLTAVGPVSEVSPIILLLDLIASIILNVIIPAIVLIDAILAPILNLSPILYPILDL